MKDHFPLCSHVAPGPLVLHEHRPVALLVEDQGKGQGDPAGPPQHLLFTCSVDRLERTVYIFSVSFEFSGGRIKSRVYHVNDEVFLCLLLGHCFLLFFVRCRNSQNFFNLRNFGFIFLLLFHNHTFLLCPQYLLPPPGEHGQPAPGHHEEGEDDEDDKPCHGHRPSHVHISKSGTNMK